MKLETIQIDNTVRSGLNSFTDGVIIRDTKVLITLNLPDGQKTTIGKRTARTVLTGMCYSVGSVMRQGSSSLTRLTGQSAMTSRTWRR